MKKRYFAIIFLIILLAYLIFFPRELERELVYVPSWAVSLGSNSSGKSASGAPVPFVLNRTAGFLDGSGKLIHIEPMNDGAAVSERFLINYYRNPDSLELRNPDGSLAASIPDHGSPFFSGGRLFTVSADRLVLSEYSEDGSRLWSVSPGAVITSVDAAAGLCVAGFLNGSVSVFDSSGNTVFTYFSPESRYSVVYGVAVSPDGRYLAVVCGLNPQQLIVFADNGDRFIPVYKKELADEFRRNLFIYFSEDSGLLYVENPSGLSVLDLQRFSGYSMELGGRLLAASLNGGNGISYIATESPGGTRLVAFKPGVGTVSEFEIPEGELFFRDSGNCIYFGIGDIIVRIDLVEG